MMRGSTEPAPAGGSCGSVGAWERGGAEDGRPPIRPHPHTPPLLATAWLCAAAILLAAGALPAAEEAPAIATPAALALQRLEQSFHDVKTVQAAFRQERRLAMFTRPVIIEGRISLEVPGRMAWHVEKPLRYGFVMSDTEIRQWDEATGRAVAMPVNANPVLKVVSQQMPRWFAGQFQTLAGIYDATVVSNRPCVLAFTPRAGAAPDSGGIGIQRMTVTFREDERYVQQVQIEEPGGDLTTIVFTDVRLNEPIDPRAWEVKPRG